jgi:glucan phosphoethanolaminetransferase (alkaline phosphatase superfamily)
MSSIFTGFLFIFLDLNLTFGQARLELIPDFIGYIILLNGLKEMSGESPAFDKVRPFATVMAFYTGIVWLFDLLGSAVSLGPLSFILGIVSLIISFYISYKIVMGVKDMEARYGTDLNGRSLNTAYSVLFITGILSYLLLLLPALAILCIIVSLIAAICFLVAFHRSKNLYYSLGPH